MAFCNMNVEFRAKESKAQRDSVTCVRSQSEFTAKSGSDLSPLKSSLVCFLYSMR